MTITIDARRRWRTVAARVRSRRLFVLPLVFMVLGSFRPPGLDPPDGFELIPPEWTLRNYQIIFQLLPLWRNIGNSFIVVVVAVPITVLVASLAGFAMATSTGRSTESARRDNGRGDAGPADRAMGPALRALQVARPHGHAVPLIAPALMATTPFYVLIFALAYYRIPKHVFEAAQLDGLSPFQIWRRIAFPLAKPAAFAIAVLAFVAYWSNFVDPLLYLSSNENFTLSLALGPCRRWSPRTSPCFWPRRWLLLSLPCLPFWRRSGRSSSRRWRSDEKVLGPRCGDWCS